MSNWTYPLPKNVKHQRTSLFDNRNGYSSRDRLLFHNSNDESASCSAARLFKYLVMITLIIVLVAAIFHVRKPVVQQPSDASQILLDSTLLSEPPLALLQNLNSFRQVPEFADFSSTCKLKPPLFLTPYIKTGDVNRGRELSRVVSLPGNNRNLSSYSGFITVNESDFSNTFFWLFETTNKTLKHQANAPLLIYLDGGPGVSSLYNMFLGNGPFAVDANARLVSRNVTWTNAGDMLYIDNPVGTGFSFTNTDAGYSRNQVQIGWNLYNFLVQFYQLFPAYLKRPLYLTGESYAGKYVPALAYRIHMQNQQLPNHQTQLKMPLAGCAVNGAWSDPENMYEAYGALMFNLGMIDRVGMETVDKYTANVKRLIQSGKLAEAAQEDDKFITGYNPENQPTLFFNLTGSLNPWNALQSDARPDETFYERYLQRCDVRNAIHVGSLPFTVDNRKVLHMLRHDMCDTVRHWLPTVFDNYRTLIYAGQFDIGVGAPLVERFLFKLENWTSRADYVQAPHSVWKVHDSDTEIAGYVKTVRNQFYHAVVRGAGHMVPMDQPERCYDLIQRFILNQTF